MKGLIRPWYRSRLFWLGVPGFLFLMWAWTDSNVRVTQFNCEGREAACVIQSRSGAINFDAQNGDWGEMSFSSHSEPLDGMEERWFPAAFSPETKDDDPFDPVNQPAEVAYWAIVLGYMMLWGATVAVWQRRKQRLAPKP
ncbi:hypothetical protein OKA04_04140 [Luteolibacter flavescens]|uniref:DUF3592 domain-containing protein n=1 Tax=Luteolibacter flavescens TaxID=1859460 RepID=A0ABT3FKP0_9BACT|nr:hypothetical protein [Luteolibacter flavescens]MCW1883904.1 hypothetical protein [Luteolibacter flavescens]